ncbi:MAG: DUF433 domain-containing protein [Candidatus Omnitrophota bacterium]
MTLINRIEINPDIMLGKPVVRGTRIPVELILRKLSERASEADFLDAFSQLTPEDIQAAILYAEVMKDMKMKDLSREKFRAIFLFLY